MARSARAGRGRAVSLRVAIVDDEPLARERIRELLSAHGDVEVVAECADGRSAVAELPARAPDIVFLDIQMPEVDGFGVVEALGTGRLPEIVFVTAFDEYAVRAFEAEALDYLLKPVTAERFEAALARARARLGRYATRFVARDGARLTFILDRAGRQAVVNQPSSANQRDD